MKLILAIDGSARSDAATAAVINQFRPRDTDVRVLHVVEWPDQMPGALAFAPGVPATGAIMDLHEETRRQGEELLARTVDRLVAAGFSATRDLREGDPRHVILECADEWQPDLIVLASHGRTGLDRILIGSVSESVVRHAKCSVEVVR